LSPQAHPQTWFTIEEAASICKRTPKTILNLISQHQLPRRKLWVVRQRMRFRKIFVSPETVAYLQELTLHGVTVKLLKLPK
jgi:Helix-turn-helix domain